MIGIRTRATARETPHSRLSAWRRRRPSLQLAGARLDARAEASDAVGETSFVMIGQLLQTEALLELLASAEALGAAGDECGLCDEKTVAAQEDEDARVTEGADRFTAYVKHDTRFELQWVRGALVAFKLPPMLGASSEELNSEMMHDMNTRSSGRYWLAPHRSDVGELQLLSSVANKHEAQGCWVEVQKVTERMMAKYFEGVFCGGCNCLEQLAGKALT